MKPKSSEGKGIKEKQKIYFSGESQKTMDAWTGGCSYKHLFAFELFGYKLEFWKKL